MKYNVGALTCQTCGGTRHTVNFGKRGTGTITCLGDDCGAQTFVKSPAGVYQLLQRLNIPAPWLKDPHEKISNSGGVPRGGVRRAAAGKGNLAVVQGQ